MSYKELDQFQLMCQVQNQLNLTVDVNYVIGANILSVVVVGRSLDWECIEKCVNEYHIGSRYTTDLVQVHESYKLDLTFLTFKYEQLS